MTGISAGTSGRRAPSSDTASTRDVADETIPATASPEHGHHVPVVGDEADLRVQAGVLGEVPGGVVWLGPEHRPDLVHPLEHADHGLLEELRRLGEVGALGRSSRCRRRSRRTRWRSRRSSACGSRCSRSRPTPTRNPATEAAAISNWARRAGCRNATAALSKMVGRVAGTTGRYRSNGGAATASPSTVIRGSVSSAPPGAWGLAVTRPVTSTTVSSAGAGPVVTTWASPDRSRTITNVTAFSSRPRCTQPATRTRSPVWAANSVASTRAIIATPVVESTPWGCGREGNSRCHRTFAAVWRDHAGTSLRPADGGRPAGHCWRRSSPHSGGSSPGGRESAFAAAGGSLTRVDPGYLSPSTCCGPA